MTVQSDALAVLVFVTQDTMPQWTQFVVHPHGAGSRVDIVPGGVVGVDALAVRVARVNRTDVSEFLVADADTSEHAWPSITS